MTSASEVVAEWQHPSAGDDIRLHPDVALQVAVATRRPSWYEERFRPRVSPPPKAGPPTGRRGAESSSPRLARPEVRYSLKKAPRERDAFFNE